MKKRNITCHLTNTEVVVWGVTDSIVGALSGARKRLKKTKEKALLHQMSTAVESAVQTVRSAPE